MLKPAILYKMELERLYLEKLWFNDKYYTYHNNYSTMEIQDTTFYGNEFVSVDKYDKIIGFISYSIDRNANYAYQLGIIKLDDTKKSNTITFSLDLKDALKDIFERFNFNKLNFDVVIGNPVENQYDKLIHKYNGRIIGIKKNDVRLIDNNLYDVKMYEITKDEYYKSKTDLRKFS